MPAPFVHLHTHSQYSMLDGAIRLESLVPRIAELGMPSVALTDHGNMFGAVQFYKACSAAKVKPILGCEVNVTGGKQGDPNSKDSHHLVLLASGQEGYANLVRLVSLGWVDGMYRGAPRIDFDVLREHRKGVIGLSACMGGYLAQEILQKGEEAGRSAMGRLRDAFDPEHFYVELQDHGFVEQGPLNEILVGLARDLAVPYVASNDCHYLGSSDAKAQLVLQCIGAARTFDEMKRAHHGSEELFVKSGDQMLERFRGYPEALSNTLRVAEMCAGTVSPLAPPKLPRFQVPEGTTEDAFLRELSMRGLERRFEELRAFKLEFSEQQYRDRLNVELDVIVPMGFSGYFLIVQDFINWGKEHGVPVGPGRGSGAGSLVAWALRITDLDPIPYGLLFERFLNPERVSMPDFDVDFCMDKRDRVIEYVRERYGRKSVGQIATFHLLKSRSVVKDVGRALGMAPVDTAKVASLVPEPVQGKTTPIIKALELEPRLKALYDGEPQTKNWLDTAMSLEDLTRHAGMHAAGVVISEGPLWDHVPVFCPEPGVYVTQYHKDDVEYAGLVKFDFLGLKTLTVLDIAVQLIGKRPDRDGTPFDLSAIPLNDLTTFSLLSSGETTNVFQLESSGMQSLFKQLKPDCFEDIVAAVALYRPGPLGSGMVEDFVQRKHGRVKVEYPHKSLEAVLKDTYGVIVYQEQVMQIAREMGGYSLGGADLLRRAMGKKKAEEMQKQKATFIEGALAKGHSAEDANRVFDLMEYFAGYGFNKSHSAAYALITYQTAYLKAHFPVEFTCATLSADKDKIEKVVRTVAEARSMGITVLPPDVNESAIDFTVVYEPAPDAPKRKKNQPVSHRGKIHEPLGPKIRFGLGGVKGVGEGALEAIFEARSGKNAGEEQREGVTHDPFVDLFDLAARVDLRRVNKGVLEALVQCGAFDTVHSRMYVTRASAFMVIEHAVERGRSILAEKNSGQTNLFGLLGAGDAPMSELPSYVFPKVEPWDQRETLAREKSALGFYVSGHPLDRFATELRRICNATTESLANMSEGFAITIGGSVEGFRERPTKTGHRIAFFSLEDSSGRVEVIVRPKMLSQEGVREALQSGDPVLVSGVVQFESSRGGNPNAPPSDGDDGAPEPKILLDAVTGLAEALKSKTKAVKVRLKVDRLERTQLIALRDALMQYPGNCPVTLEIASTSRWCVAMNGGGISVDPSERLLASLERIFGEKVAELR